MKKLAASGAIFATFFACGAAWAGPTQQSFTPTAYEYPLSRISLARADGTGAVDLYLCPGATPADCRVDLADSEALAALSAAAQGVELSEGEYTQLVLSMCGPGTSGSDTTSVSVLGTVDVGGTQFSTSEAAAGGMSEGDSPEFTDVSLGCGQIALSLLQPIVVTEGADVSLTLLVDLTDMVWTDQGASPGMGGCKADGAELQDLCTTMPNVVPFVGAGTPSLERYLIAHSIDETVPELVDANAAVNLAVAPDGDVFWVLVQPYYTATSPSWVDAQKGGGDYNTQVRTLSTNEDGSIAFQTGGSIEDDRVGFASFLREDHDGVCKNEDPASPSWNYRAFAQ